MNIFEFFKNLLKKDTTNINGLINISDSFVVPTRKLFKQNTKVLDLIDTYKEEYKKVLSDKKLLLSMDLTNSVNEDIRMYSALITNIFTNEENVVDSNVEEKIKMYYKVNKLNLYSQQISKLNLECTARLVALLEIFNERKLFMPKYKKEPILFAINNLTNALVVFEAQKSAIEVEKENFLNKYVTLTSDNEDTLYEEKWKEFILDRARILDRAYIFDKEFERLDLSDILIREMELEVYSYKFKEEAKTLQKEIDKYCELIKDEKSLADFCMTAKIYDLESKTLLYYYYGKNLINIEYIYKLYELKLIFLLLKKVHFSSSNPKLCNIEKESYKYCIYKRIDNITSGKNPVIEKNFGHNARNAIKYIIDELKSEGQFDIKDILTSHKLYFLFSFDYEDGFINHLNSSTVTRDYFSYCINFYDRIFTWDAIIPLSSLFEMVMLNNLDPKFCLDVNRCNLYKLYQAALNYYKLPEGIKEIHLNSLDEFRKYPLVKKLQSKAKGKKLVLPHSLETFHGRLFLENTIKALILNDGIRDLGTNALSCTSDTEIVVPPSLEYISNSYMNVVDGSNNMSSSVEQNIDDTEWYEVNHSYLSNLRTIIFRDYTNSKLLKNKKALGQLLADSLYFVNGKFFSTLDCLIFANADNFIDCVFFIKKSDLQMISTVLFTENGQLDAVSVDDIDLLIQNIYDYCASNDHHLRGYIGRNNYI